MILSTFFAPVKAVHTRSICLASSEINLYLTIHISQKFQKRFKNFGVKISNSVPRDLKPLLSHRFKKNSASNLVLLDVIRRSVQRIYWVNLCVIQINLYLTIHISQKFQKRFKNFGVKISNSVPRDLKPLLSHRFKKNSASNLVLLDVIRRSVQRIYWVNLCVIHCARAKQLLSKKCRCSGERLAPLCLI